MEAREKEGTWKQVGKKEKRQERRKERQKEGME